jgi:tricorn protease
MPRRTRPRKRDKPKVVVKIDFDNIGQRILALPLPARRYVDLQAGKAGVLFALEAPPPGAGENAAVTVHRFDLKTRKSDVAIGGVRSFEISQDGEKMLYQQGEKWAIAAPKPMATGSSPAPPPPPAGDSEKTLKTDGIEVRVNPREEWKQMYREAWRIERDFFYDPKIPRPRPGGHGKTLRAVSGQHPIEGRPELSVF